jgi:hypothetical protein
MSGRMTAVDAQFYRIVGQDPQRPVLLCAFDGEPTQHELAVVGDGCHTQS